MRSLQGRLFAAIALGMVGVVAITLLVGGLFVRRALDRSVEASLERQASLLALAGVRNPSILTGSRAPAVFLRRIGESVTAIALPAVAGDAALPSGAIDALNAGQPVTGRTSIDGQRVLFAAQPAGDRAVVVFRVTQGFPADSQPFVVALVVAALVGVGVAAVVSYWLAGRITGPVQRVAEASRQIAAGQRVTPIPVEGQDELSTLAASFNAMAGDLARAREAEAAFLLSVSHDLKTPLTSIRGYAEAVDEGVVEPKEAALTIARESANLERLVQDLLDLARLQRRAFDVRSEDVDLAAIASEVVERFQPKAREFVVALAAHSMPSPGPGVRARADRDRVLQVVSNLVENALKVSPAGGSVVITSGPGEISVRDTGPGIPAEDIPRAFERFYLHKRYGRDRAVGSGLGLAIVKELTEAMGGRVTVASSPGAGTEFVVHLPV